MSLSSDSTHYTSYLKLRQWAQQLNLLLAIRSMAQSYSAQQNRVNKALKPNRELKEKLIKLILLWQNWNVGYFLCSIFKVLSLVLIYDSDPRISQLVQDTY